jgi:hypothetical protein
VSSSGLIYAVIVGAWAAYLVPMWLRRQDELNEARPTERFSTAIRLLSGRAAMERKASRSLDDDSDAGAAEPPSAAGAGPATPDRPAQLAPDRAASDRAASAHVAPGRAGFAQPGRTEPVRSAHAQPGTQAQPRTLPPHAAAPLRTHPAARERASSAAAPRPAVRPTAPPFPSGNPSAPPVPPASAATPQRPDRRAAGRRDDPRRRAALLARRRRMVILLFAAFTLGMIAAAVGGVALLWLPAIPAVLFSCYIAHLRRQERRRFEVKLDRRRAAEAAQQLRDRERERRRAAADPATAAVAAPPAADAPSPRPRDFDHPAPVGRTAGGSGVHHVQALVEAADSDDADDTEESDESDGWGGGTREHSADGASWDPVPVPLPTYVTAPVAPRSTGSALDLNAPDTWSAGRSTPASPPPPTPAQAPKPKRRQATPLFDQYADDTTHPRAANQ